jgi:transcriptional regulator with XRE-family HTH domain
MILRLRTALSLSQREFSARLKVTQVALARWETSRIPSQPVLRKLATLARMHGLEEYARFFEDASGPQSRIGSKVNLTVSIQSLDEYAYTLACLRVYRRRDLYPEQYGHIDAALAEPRAFVERVQRLKEIDKEVSKAVARLLQVGVAAEKVEEMYQLTPEQVGRLALQGFQLLTQEQAEQQQKGG